MSSNYPNGAEWRKWDLHFHTPSSYDYNDKSVTNDDIIKTLSQNEISVVAITDHHVMDVDRIKDLQNKGSKENITVLPGIEFLSDARGSDPIHFIGIFSENCQIEYIWGQIQNKTAISRIIAENKKVNEVYCDLIETIELVHSLGGVITIHSGQKHGTVETITNSLVHTMAQKEDIAQNVDIYELGKEEDQGGYKKVVFPYIQKTLPMVICSDNHNCKSYKLKVNCWLKADPTFDGLKQVINEPEERVYIGDKPPLFNSIDNHRTKYIESLSINKTEGYNNAHGVWFDNISITLNKELVAIIGNKGSGKSAIADIISFCANVHNIDDFSFIHSDKFRDKNGKIAKHFEANLRWVSGTLNNKGLYDEVDRTEVPLVKYIPQGQFERLTNEISTVEKFQKEIESVVFSHIPDSENLNAKSFEELIEKKTTIVESELNSLYEQIDYINKEIIFLEHKATSNYEAEIENKLNNKREELNALIKPEKTANPNEDPEKKKQNEVINSKIQIIKNELESIEKQIEDATSKKKVLLNNLQVLKDTKNEVLLKKSEFEHYISEKKTELKDFKINVDKMISVTFDLKELDKNIESLDAELLLTKKELGEVEQTDGDELVKSLSSVLEQKQKLLKDETAKLDAEQKKYQDYLTALKNWETERKKVIGSEETVDSLKYFEAELNYLKEKLEGELLQKYDLRKEISESIFEKRQDIIGIYKEARNKLNAIILEHADTLKDYKITIDASLVKSGNFNSRFLDCINKSVAGTFMGKDPGEAQLKKLLSEIDCDKWESLSVLLDDLIESLRFDKRDEKNAPNNVSTQVKEIEQLYSYLFKLEFLEYNYQLKQGDKNLEQLSPGERGALLLVFYLLLDKNDIPLIIDQPEDNLDNNSVATVLVPFIRAAKKNRQIIMVTHNPNLAVVSDAEQVIYVNLDKKNDCKFSVTSGSIENKAVNKKIVDVLEGAMPAFNIRRNKYYD